MLLICLVILLACFAVARCSSATRLRAVRAVHRREDGERRHGAAGGRAHPGDDAGRGSTIGRRHRPGRSCGPVGRCPPSSWPRVVGWLCWRVLSAGTTSWTWIVDLDVLFVTWPYRGGRLISRGVIGRGEAHRAAVLVPLYNEDPRRRGAGCSPPCCTSAPPAEIHVVDDGSTQGAYVEERDWFIRQAALAGIYAAERQRTPNEASAAQVHGFRKSVTPTCS